MTFKVVIAGLLALLLTGCCCAGGSDSDNNQDTDFVIGNPHTQGRGGYV